MTATVGIGRDDSGLGFAIELEVSLPEVSTEEAQALAEAAHKVCPYSRAFREGVAVSDQGRLNRRRPARHSELSRSFSISCSRPASIRTLPSSRSLTKMLTKRAPHTTSSAR